MLNKLAETFTSDILNVELEIFQDIDGEYWFHAATLCDILKISNPSVSIQRHVDDDWRKKFPAIHGKESWYVMEPGLYQLVHASESPAAKRFQRWVFGDVLKKLRSQGYYIAQTDAETLTALEAKISELQESNKLLEVSTGQAQLESQRASEAAQKFLNYFWALNNFAFELLISVGHFRNPKYIAQFQKQEFLAQVWRKVEIALNFVCEHKETIQKLESQTVAYETCVNPELAQDRIKDFLKYFES
jgi:prophage antirepressor-like protein